MSPPGAICFDLDSTLCLSTQSDHEIHAQVFEQAGIEPLFSPGELRAVDATTLDAAESDTEFYRETGRVPRGRSEIRDFRDDETLRVSNHSTPRVKAVKL